MTITSELKETKRERTERKQKRFQLAEQRKVNTGPHTHTHLCYCCCSGFGAWRFFTVRRPSIYHFTMEF
ncbi:uncharacterized protein Dwil_GK26798 [Drosophila willistoni]|uniref:Uncharacterized protein n=1 Tax=Drosophila willistoni TaxID=7260 RepID=A0A0Q9WUS5_DROWI|nr:uncharacterized protein Dwil_GK26798 [Drosophila willistoni]